MKHKLYKLGAVLFTLVLTAIVFWPTNHWRLYDDLWRPLALTQAENYCSGVAVALSDYDEAAEVAPGCLESSGMDNLRPSITNSIPWACQGINSVDSWPVDECIGTMEQYEIWFLLGGGYTNAWSDARPRPTPPVSEVIDGGRGESRGDFGAEPATTTTTESEE